MHRGLPNDMLSTNDAVSNVQEQPTISNVQEQPSTSHSVELEVNYDGLSSDSYESDEPEENPDCFSYSHSSRLSLKDNLKIWFIEHKPTVKCTNDLLKVLKNEHLNVPLSTEGLLGKRLRCIERTVSPGQYVHIGLGHQLQKLTEAIEKSSLEKIVIDIGIDGLPLYTSSLTGLWPILGRLVNLPNCENFIIGCYIGIKKPYDINCFLHDFVNDISEINDQGGIIIKNEMLKVEIRAFICDAPAKSFVCGIKGHNSLSGCPKCQQVGQRVDNVTTFSTTTGEKRTDEDFRLRKYQNFHQPMHFNMEMVLEQIGINMISQFIIDPMHLLDLGITKKILLHILNKKTIIPVKSSNTSISENILSLMSFIPKEFKRKGRILTEISRWKATEFRLFILYTGIVILKDCFPIEMYEHFLLIHCSYRILLTFQSTSDIEKAHEMIKLFVEKFPAFYGRASVTYNVHCLLHLAECVKEFGSLSSLSAYSFENYMKTIKKNIKMPKHIGQQIFNSFAGRKISIKTKIVGPNYVNDHVNSFFLNKGYFSSESPDNICLMNNKQFVMVTKFVNETSFLGKPFVNPTNFFNYPTDSLDLNIALVKEEETDENVYDINNIFAKVIKLPYHDNFVLIPETH